MIKYYKLFDLLNRRNMKLSDLRNILSSATVAKLKKGEYISGEALEKICLYLNCQPGDIMEVVSQVDELILVEHHGEIEPPKDNIITEKKSIIANTIDGDIIEIETRAELNSKDNEKASTHVIEVDYDKK